jgi:hypothetical protein
MRPTIFLFAFLTPSCTSQHDQPEARTDSAAFANSAQPAHGATTPGTVTHSREGVPPDRLASLGCPQSLTIDVAAPSVAGVRLDPPDSLIEAALPPGSVKRNVVVYDTDTVTTYTINLCGHVLELGTNGIYTTDSAFVTTEGLHVGLPIARFDEAWGGGQPMWSEAGWVMYYFKKVSINAGATACVSFGQPNAQPTVDRDCRVESIWVSTPTRVGAR